MSSADRTDKGRETASDSDLTLDLNFVPQWARRPPDAVRIGRFDDAEPSPRRGRGDARGARDDRRGDRRPPPRRAGDGPRRRPDRPGDQAGGPPPRDGMRPRREETARPAADSRPRSAERGPVQQDGRRGAPPAPPVESLPLNVRFLPEQKALSDMIRRVSASHRAYPLLDLAALLMSQDGLCYVKLDVLPGARDFKLYQCRHCGTLARSRDVLEAHVLEAHVDLIFDVQEEAVDPPSGVFVCVAKCGYSGELLGPPNHHSYAEAVKRLHAERFANMDFEVYRRHIQTSHDEADVERWKEQASRRVVYRLKGTKTGDGEAADAGMSWVDAQRHMRAEVAPAAVETVRRVALPEKVAHGIHDPAIRRMLREEWQQESRFPIHLAFALRAAFRHRGLHLFKTGGGHGKGMNFVTAVKPVPLDPETAIPEIRDALLFMQAHPGCSRKDMVEALRPGSPPDSEDVKALLQPIHWLVEKGHVIEFFNGTLSVPRLGQH